MVFVESEQPVPVVSWAGGFVGVLDGSESASRLVPVSMDGLKVYLYAQEVGAAQAASGEEHEIASRQPRLEQVVDGLAGFAKQLAGRLQETDAVKIAVEFGCDIAVESGSFIAVIGKASASSSFKVSLEWGKTEA
jgi:hypothetical protein